MHIAQCDLRPATCELRPGREVVVLTPESVRHRDVLDIFRDLGYPIAPVAITADEWRRAGVEIGWNGTSSFHLIARMRRFDLFLLESADAAEESLHKFLSSYRSYNVITKSALIYRDRNSVAIYDLAQSGRLRRLDVDLDEPSAHAIDRLNLLAAGEQIEKIFDLALDRESVTRRFFERFRDAMRDVALTLPEDEALLILSRLLFLSFIQEKGWLNNERRFLFDRLDTPRYFASVLKPLFFGCLNTPPAERDVDLGKIPYLNGGLFEPSKYERQHPDFDIDDDLIRRVIVDVFERFDFSSDEHDDAGTHVDPEMLGKVFESLMAEDERAASGHPLGGSGIAGLLSRVDPPGPGLEAGAGGERHLLARKPADQRGNSRGSPTRSSGLREVM